MSNRRLFDVDITLVQWKENINDFPHPTFWRIFYVISMGEKSMSFRRNFFDIISFSKKIELVSTYFLQL